MTLEEFFTSTEVKDGLTTPAHVEELISIIKKERIPLVKNISDPITKQWASVASSITATNNKECLDLFVQLDGIYFLNEWLKFAQTFPKNEGDTFVDEVILLLLQAVEKLEIDNERLSTSGICITVKNLVNYSSDKVKDQARTLFDSWKSKNVDLINMDPTMNNEQYTSSFQSIDDNHRCNSQPLDYNASEDGCRDTVSSPKKMDSIEGDNEASCEVLKSEGVSGDASQCGKIGSVCAELGKVEVSSDFDGVDIPSNNSGTVGKEGENDTNDDIDVDANTVVGGSRDEIEGEETSSRIKDTDNNSKAKKDEKKNEKYFGSGCGFTRLAECGKNNDIINRTNMDLEDGTVDALEVACFLAKQVEREVMDYDEQSATSSSNETMSRNNDGQPQSPESINGEDPEIKAHRSNDSPTTNNNSNNNVPRGPTEIQHTIDPINQDMESSSQVTGVCEFDLNQEIERGGSDGGTSSGSRHRRDFLDFDLNVRLSPDRSEKMEIDLNLNQIGEDVRDVMPHVLKVSQKILGFENTSCRSLSPASSSSCLQPCMRNFDLNDNPSHSSNISNQHLFMSESSSHKTGSYVGPSDDSVISILGVKVKANAVLPQTTPFLNKRVSETVLDTTHLLRGGSFVPYGYNGLAMGPLVSFPPALTYGPGGPLPYMFDSRGAPVMPHIFGSPPIGQPTYGQPSFVLNMMGSSPPGSLGPNLNLNHGFKQFLGPGHIRPLQEQLRDHLGSFGSGSSTGKRKEPDTGWDLYAGNYKHHKPPHL